MKIATWNVNSIRTRLGPVLAWLEARKPDALCLQETKVTDEEFPFEELKKVGYQAIARGQRAYNGVAILAREQPADPDVAFDDGAPDSEARLIAGTVGGVRVVSVYVPNGQSPGSEKYQFKIEWMGRLREYMARAAERHGALCLCGDFNVAPEDQDVFDPRRWEGEIMCTEPERAALRGIVSKGLTDAFRLVHPQGHHFTWWDYRLRCFERDRGLRIDHIYVTDSLAKAVRAAEVDRDVRAKKSPSDHAPVLVTLQR